VSVSLCSPPAPSPAAATTNGAPGAGLLPVRMLKVFVFVGGVVTPFWKVSEIEVCGVMKPPMVGRMSASTESVRGPSTNFADGSLKVYGAS
jgi:hypothetical protein